MNPNARRVAALGRIRIGARLKARPGVISVCAAGGLGVTAIMEAA